MSKNKKNFKKKEGVCYSTTSSDYTYLDLHKSCKDWKSKFPNSPIYEDLSVEEMTSKLFEELDWEHPGTVLHRWYFKN